MEIRKPSAKTLNEAQQILQRGGVIVCPTDTVYGFLADAGNKKAVGLIYKIKQRPKEKPLPLFVADVAMAKRLASVDGEQEKALKKYWPGKYTFILERKAQKSKRKTTTQKLKLYDLDEKTVAMRIPRHAFLGSLLKKVNRPLAQTSVNVSGQPSMRSAKEIIAQFGVGKHISLIIDAGTLRRRNPSRIIDLSAEKQIRLR